MPASDDHWVAGNAYEGYMGRWSRPLAASFVPWLRPRSAAAWLEIGCGTGALTQAICERAAPASVLACDPSESFVEHARRSLGDARVTFVVAGAEQPAGAAGSFDYAVSALVLNLLADPAAAVARMRESLRAGGVIGACVWDYAEGMEFLRAFWDAAVALDPKAEALDEGRRFPLCRPDALSALFARAGLKDVAIEGLVVPTHFRGFDEFWLPFLKGTGPAPSYAAALSPLQQEGLREGLARRLTPDADGVIRLNARAWAVQGSR
jgi:SAM-dependent methyltransferase